MTMIFRILRASASLLVIMLHIQVPQIECSFHLHTERPHFPLLSSFRFKERTSIIGTSILAATTTAGTAPNLEQPVVLYPSPEAANGELDRILKEGDDTTLMSVEGFISKRRALSSNLAFLDVVVSDNDDSIPPVQALLRREFYQANINNNSTSDSDVVASSFKAYMKVLQPGTRVSISGHVGPSRNPNEVLLFVHKAIFLTPNSNPQHMKNVMRLIHSGDLPLDQFARALCIEPQELEKQFQDLGDAKDISDECYNTLGIRILSNMTNLLDPSKLMGSSDSAKVKMLPPVPMAIASPPATIINSNASERLDTPETTSVQDLLDFARFASNSNVLPIPLTTVSGWVRNRRRFQESVTWIEVVDEYSPQDEEQKDNDNGKIKLSTDLSRLKCILHPKMMAEEQLEENNQYNCDNKKSVQAVDLYGGILCAGSRVMLQGYVVKGGDGQDDDAACLWVTNARLIRSSWRPKVVRQILELMTRSEIDTEEAAGALELPGGMQEAENISETKKITERQWKAAEISRRLQDATSRLGEITPEMERILELSQIWRSEYPLPEEAPASGVFYSGDQKNGTQLKKSFAGSRWQRKKKPQLDWMIEQIERVIQSHPSKRPLQIVDVGGGKGYLAGLIAEHFGSNVVDVRVVDIAARAVKNGMMRARKRNLDNIRFDVGDATVTDLAGVDIVVALHACGALSDVAIGHAVSHGAAFVVCPCCFRSNPNLMVKATHGLLHTNNDSTSSGLVAASDWLGVDSEDYETLKKVAEIQGDVNMAGQAMHAICALRAKAAQEASERVLKEGDPGGAQLQVEIKRFPIGLSTRNICIIGTVSNTIE